MTSVRVSVDDRYAEACRDALLAAGCRAEEHRGFRGIVVVSGTDAAGLPFFYAHPMGRASSWRAACVGCGVCPPVIRVPGVGG